MAYKKALRAAERHLVDGATLPELKETAENLRALTPDSPLADLVDARIEAIEDGDNGTRDKLRHKPSHP